MPSRMAECFECEREGEAVMIKAPRELNGRHANSSTVSKAASSQARHAKDRNAKHSTDARGEIEHRYITYFEDFASRRPSLSSRRTRLPTATKTPNDDRRRQHEYTRTRRANIAQPDTSKMREGGRGVDLKGSEHLILREADPRRRRKCRPEAFSAIAMLPLRADPSARARDPPERRNHRISSIDGGLYLGGQAQAQVQSLECVAAKRSGDCSLPSLENVMPDSCTDTQPPTDTGAKPSDIENKVTVSAFARRRLAVVMVRLKMAETVSDAVRTIEQGHVRVGPTPVTDPALLVTRNMEDFVTWVDGSTRKRTIMRYNDELDDFDLL